MTSLKAGRKGRAILAAALTLSASALVLEQAAAQDMPVSTRADRVYMEAEILEERRGEGIYIARGSVRLQTGDRIVYADEIIYDTNTGRVLARGSVRLFEGDAPAQLADEIELDDAMQEGVAYGFATLLENNGRAAAVSAVRRPDGSVELTDAYYTACDLCEDGGEPTWRLRADRVVRDLDDDMIYYRDVRLEVAGVPVLYSPVFAHADPSAERKSGFLLPSVDISNRLGLVYQQPYLWVIGPSQDLVIAPRIMTEASPLLELDYRKRFFSGEIEVETSFTYEQEFDQDGFFGPEQLRGHIFANGLFSISRDWRWGFGVQAASEDLYLQRYDYNTMPEEVAGLFAIEEGLTLVNQLFVAGKGDHYYTDVSTLAFDQLTDGFDDDRLPYMTPFWRFAADGELPFRLGDFDIMANAVNLRRELGDDYARATVGASWSRPVIAPGGIRLEGFATGRIDSYRELLSVAGAPDEVNAFTRARGAAGLDVSYPFVRPGSRFDIVVAPRTAVIASNGGDPEQRPTTIQDAVSVDFERGFLFQPVRAPGFDVFEDGVRADVGFETELRDVFNRFEAEAFVGRSYRLAGGDERFAQASGLFEDESDWLTEFSVTAGPVSAGASARLDSETGEINRIAANLGVEVWRVKAAAEYLDVSDDASLSTYEELNAGARVAITENWDAFYSGLFDLGLNEDRLQTAGFEYRDECTSFRVFWERENINFGNLGPSTSVKFEIVLFTLGGVADD